MAKAKRTSVTKSRRDETTTPGSSQSRSPSAARKRVSQQSAAGGQPQRKVKQVGDGPAAGPTLGQRVPEIILPSTGPVGSVNLGASGAKVVYFYPKDNTSGCTLEAQEFGLLASAFRKLKVEVFGVSKDSLKSHEAFKGKLRLGFELLEDHSGEACAFFGVWVEKSMYGRKYHGIERATYLIGPDGHIHRAWRKVQAKGHAEEVLQAAREMMK